MVEEYRDFAIDLLEAGYTIQKMACGDSMLPAIPEKTVLRIKPVKDVIPKPGQIVMIRSGEGGVKIHRISMVFVRQKKLWVQTWGDNCYRPDLAVHVDQLLGYITAYKAGETWVLVRYQLKTYLYFFYSRYLPYYIKRLGGRLL